MTAAAPEVLHPAVQQQRAQDPREPGWAQLTEQYARRQSAGRFNYDHIKEAQAHEASVTPGPVNQVDYSMSQSWYVRRRNRTALFAPSYSLLSLSGTQNHCSTNVPWYISN